MSGSSDTQSSVTEAVIPLTRPGPRSVHLPVPPTSLFGRERDAGAVRDLVLAGPRRLVTLTGPGGVGKTRLALRVAAGLADHFDDGVTFVSLASELDVEALPVAVNTALGLAAAPGAAVDASALDRLIAALRDRRTLLVLDNLEQLVDEIAVLSTLLAACTGLRILATSRVRLRLSDEQEYQVGPLPLPAPTATAAEVRASPPVALFAERVSAVRPGFALSDAETTAVADICRRLDGLPLAIELAAARVPHLSPTSLSRALADSPGASALPLLTAGARDAPVRHRTLRDAIAWSIDLLDPSTRATFARLGVFAGGFTLDAAEMVAAGINDSVLSPQSSVLDQIAALIDASLVRLQSGSESRYVMLETVREYALHVLEGTGEADLMRERLAAWLIDLNLRAFEQVRGPDEEPWLERLGAEQLNLRSILAWCLDRGDAGTALRLITKGNWFLWGVRGTRRDESRWLVRALDLAERDPGRLDPAVLGHGLHALGMYLHRVGEYERAHDLLDTAVRHLRDADDRTGTAIALGNLANLLHDLGDFDGARAALAEAIAIHRQFGDPSRLIIPLINLSAISITVGDFPAAAAAIEESAVVIHQAGNARDVAYLNHFRGVIAVHTGNAASAEALLTEALTQFRALPDAQGIAMAPKYLAESLLHTGRPAAAARVLTEAFPVLLRMDLRPNATLSLDTLANIALRVGRATDGARMFGASAAIRATLNAEEGRIVDREKLAAISASALAALGPDHYLAAETAGRHLSFETAMTEALALAESIAGDDVATQHEVAQPPSPLHTLTAREREILGLLVDGLSDREIANRLSLSHRTVSNHVGRILAKLDAPSRTAAVAIALREDLRRPSD